MLEVLDKVLSDMPNILQPDVSEWARMTIDSEPYLHRLVRPIVIGKEQFDLFLHKSYTTGVEASPHTHPCQAAMYIAQGRYKLVLGVGEQECSEISTIILNTGCKYEMTQRNTWHYFTPLSDYTLSVMVAGRMYNTKQSGQPGRLGIELTEEKAQEILEEFRNLEW